MKVALRKAGSSYYIVADGKRIDGFIYYCNALRKFTTVLYDEVGFDKAIQLLAFHQTDICRHNAFFVEVHAPTQTESG